MGIVESCSDAVCAIEKFENVCIEKQRAYIPTYIPNHLVWRYRVRVEGYNDFLSLPCITRVCNE